MTYCPNITKTRKSNFDLLGICFEKYFYRIQMKGLCY